MSNNDLPSNLSYLEQDPNNVQLLINVSNDYMQLGDFTLAQDYLNKAKTIDSIGCLGQQSLLYFYQGDFLQAQAYLIDALAYAEIPALRFNLGFIQYTNLQLEEALATLDPLIEDKHFRAIVLKGRILHRQGDYEKARTLLEDIEHLQEHDAEFLGLIALVYFDLEADEDSRKACTEALLLDPENYDAQLVKILLDLNEQKTNIKDIKSLLKICPDDSRLLFALASTQIMQGNLKAAKGTLKKTLEFHPEFYDCYIMLAWCQLSSDETNQARQSYQKAVDLADDLAEGWSGLALVHALTGNYDKAQPLIERAQALDAECFLAHLANCIYSNATNPKQAKSHLIKALKKSKMPISDKLGLFIDEVHGEFLH